MSAERSISLFEPYKGYKPYIFISYSHKNKEEVFNVIAHLQKAGYRVWFDGGITPGKKWDDEIAARVKNCDYFAAFVTKEYINSDNCQDELNFAREQNRKRLLIYLSDVQLPDGMSMRQNRIQAIQKFSYRNVEEFYQKLFMTEGIGNSLKTGNDADDALGALMTFSLPTHDFFSQLKKGLKAAAIIMGSSAVLILAISLIFFNDDEPDEVASSVPAYVSDVPENTDVTSAPETTAEFARTTTTAESVADITAESVSETAIVSNTAVSELELPKYPDINSVKLNMSMDEIKGMMPEEPLAEGLTEDMALPYITYEHFSIDGEDSELKLIFSQYGLYRIELRIYSADYSEYAEKAKNYASESEHSYRKDKEEDTSITFSDSKKYIVVSTESNTVIIHCFFTYYSYYNMDGLEWGMISDNLNGSDYKFCVDSNCIPYYEEYRSHNRLNVPRWEFARRLWFSENGLFKMEYNISEDVYKEVLSDMCILYGDPVVKDKSSAEWTIFEDITLKIENLRTDGVEVYFGNL